MISLKIFVGLVTLFGVISSNGVAQSFRVVAFSTAEQDLGHISFVNEANEWFPRIAPSYNFTFESTRDWSLLNAQFLSSVDLVIFLDTRPEGAEQRRAFETYMRNGGAWLGFHFSRICTDTVPTPKTGTGITTPFSAPENTTATPGNQLQPFSKMRTETTELLKISLKSSKLKQMSDPSSFPLGTGPNPWEIWYDGYYPMVWTNKNYKMIYMNMGHNDIDYANGNAQASWSFGGEVQNRLIIDSILWLVNKN
ncbi:hypothetical protein Ocin01_07763 [Orchesella cincta]|uniref:ThuA-like domain-containing protein n=1 Tax=Orchesella cincta TaxID=48709 RepID=A0A1D2N0U7_ORCCI|nr:hypothetical protein Ocin01_07763 [Orchesella cincta]